MATLSKQLQNLHFPAENGLDRKKLVQLLLKQNEQASASVLEQIKRLEDKNTYAVLTGQQLGLLGGPLYTIYKMLNTVQLCEKLREDHADKNFVPVFWMEGEDADFDEVAKVNYIRNGELRQFIYEDEGALSLGQRELKLDINRLSFTFGFEQPFESERMWIDAFYQYFKPVLDEFGIVAFHSNRDDVREQTRPFFKHFIENHSEFSKAIFSETEKIEKNGKTVQVPLREGESFLFEHTLDQRKKLKLNDLRFSEKTRYSPNVLLRPLYQDYIFPSVAYIGGNAEINYQKQITSAYKFLKREQPLLFPRTHHVIINSKMKRLMEKYKLANISNADAFAKWKSEALRGEENDRLDALFATADQSIEKLIKELENYNFAETPTKERILAGAKNRLSKNLGQLHGRISGALSRSDKNKLAHLNYLEQHLFPAGNLQERVLPIAQFDENPLSFAKTIYSQMNIFNSDFQNLEIRN